MINLEKAKKDLEDFLKEHPELQDFQNKIDSALDGVPDEQRLLVIITMLASSSINLNKALSIALKSSIDENKKLKEEKEIKQSKTSVYVNDVFDKM